MRLTVKIKSKESIAYANKILANIISYSGKTLASIKLKNKKFETLKFNLKDVSYTDDDLKPNELLFIDKNGAQLNFFRKKGQRSNGLSFSSNAPRAFSLALNKREFGKNNIRRVIKLKSGYFTDTPPMTNISNDASPSNSSSTDISPATNSSYEFFKAGIIII